jgi:hypothetical protein
MIGKNIGASVHQNFITKNCEFAIVSSYVQSTIWIIGPENLRNLSSH